MTLLEDRNNGKAVIAGEEDVQEGINGEAIIPGENNGEDANIGVSGGASHTKWLKHEFHCIFSKPLWVT